jgi:hypothetical protein
MLTKRLLTISTLLPFMAISSVAHANHNYQHRPNQPAAYRAFDQAGPAAPASRMDLQGRPSVQPAWHYHGGPRSQMTHTGGR